MRRIIDILGGDFEGRITGRLVPGGADWPLIQEDGFTDIDARYVLETDDGYLIYVTNIGIRHARRHGAIERRGSNRSGRHLFPRDSQI